jgi:two-component system, cell cycle sensor histidine kinase and response regulator CckA
MRASPPSSPDLAALAEAIIHADLVAPWENSHYLACVREPCGRILAVNHAFGRKFGRAAAGWRDMDLALLVHPDDLASWRGLAFQLARVPHRVEHKTRWLTGQGYRWIHWEETAELGPEGEIVHYRAIGRELSGDVTVDPELRVLAAAVAGAGTALMLADMTGRPLYMNDRFIELHGQNFEETLASGISPLRAWFQSDEDFCNCLHGLRCGQAWQGLLQAQGEFGLQERGVLLPLRDVLGDVSHLLCTRDR